MAAYIALLLAVLSRLLPHLMHGTAANVTAVGAGLLFFGSRLRSASRWQIALAVLALAASDWWLTVYAYGYPFHVSAYLVTWLWYAAVCLLGSAMLSRKRGMLRVGAAALASSTGFFLLSNGMVWLPGTMYPRTGTGLLACYEAGLPFYRNDLLSTLLFSAVLFGLPALAHALAAQMDAVRSGGRPA